jgi:deoxyribose-phosphate aldolase
MDRSDVAFLPGPPAEDFALEVSPDIQALNRYFDHTLLKAASGEADIRRLCTEARAYDFFSVCVNSSHVALASELLQGSATRVCSVVGFPLGACGRDVKMYEAAMASLGGAAEIDMVMNIGALKDGRDFFVRDEIAAVVSVASEHGAAVKVIIEGGLLTDEEVFRACFLSKNAGAAFVKTSTGFLGSGATVKLVAMMRKAVGEDMGVKAAGGISDLPGTLSLIRAGADRIGASRSVAIMDAWRAAQAPDGSADR